MKAAQEELVSAVQAACRHACREENMELAGIIAEILGAVMGPVAHRLANVEQSVGLLIDGQRFVEKYLAAAMNPAYDTEEQRFTGAGDADSE
jgi:hypothetical protein